MPHQRVYSVYILASSSRTLYIGVTGRFHRRVWMHKMGRHRGFSAQYRTHSLVWFETHDYVIDAINREKQLKRWRREKKVALIETHNAGWLDLATAWYTSDELRMPSFAEVELRRDWAGSAGQIVAPE